MQVSIIIADSHRGINTEFTICSPHAISGAELFLMNLKTYLDELDETNKNEGDNNDGQ